MWNIPFKSSVLSNAANINLYIWLMIYINQIMEIYIWCEFLEALSEPLVLKGFVSLVPCWGPAPETFDKCLQKHKDESWDAGFLGKQKAIVKSNLLQWL